MGVRHIGTCNVLTILTESNMLYSFCHWNSDLENFLQSFWIPNRKPRLRSNFPSCAENTLWINSETVDVITMIHKMLLSVCFFVQNYSNSCAVVSKFTVWSVSKIVSCIMTSNTINIFKIKFCIWCRTILLWGPVTVWNWVIYYTCIEIHSLITSSQLCLFKFSTRFKVNSIFDWILDVRLF
jgi:hypothetical protein